MTKTIIEVCTLCGKEYCDGKEYKTEDMGGCSGVQIVCKNHDLVFTDKWSGKLLYRDTIGHGHYNDFYIFPAEYSDEKVKEEADKLIKEKAEIEKKEEEKRIRRQKEQRRLEYEKLKKEFED